MATITVRTQASNDANDQRKYGKRVALLGDSISDFNNDFATYPTTVQTHSRGFFTWANILVRQRCVLITPSNTDGAWGASGQTAAQLLTNGEANGAAASAADIVIVLIGTNDLTDSNNYTAAQIAANIQTIWNRQIAAGKQVVACTIMPRNNSDTAAVVQKLRDTNRLIRKNANATPGVYLCDWYNVVLNPATNLANSSAYYIDGVHPNSSGASRLGAALAVVLDRVVVPGADDLALDGGDTAQFIPNPLMIGTGGAGSTATGTFADSWTCYGGSSGVVGSKVTRTDLVPGEWQQIVVPASQNFTFQNYISVGGANQPAVGDLIYATAEFETDAASWAGTQLAITIEFNGSSNISRGPTYAENILLYRPASGVLRAPAIPVPSGATLVKVNIIAYGQGTYRIGRTQLTKVI